MADIISGVLDNKTTDEFVTQNAEIDDDTPDWAARATETVTGYVGTVRDKTTGPVLVASRYAVYVVAIALLGFVVAILLLMLMLRILVLLTGMLPFVEEGSPWFAYLMVGAIFVITGMVLWRKKESDLP